MRDLTTNYSTRESGTILAGFTGTYSSGMPYSFSDFNSPNFEALLTGLTACDYDYCLYVGNASYSSEQNSTYLDYYYIAPTANFVDPNTGNFYTGLTTISYNVDPEPGNSNTSAVLFGSNIAPDGTAAGGQNAYTRAQFGVNMTPDGNVLYVNNSGWTLATCEYGSGPAQWLSGAFPTTPDQYINVEIGINYTGSATYLSIWLNGTEVLTNWPDVDVFGNPANFPGNYVYLGSQVGYSGAQPCTLYDNLSITNTPAPAFTTAQLEDLSLQAATRQSGSLAPLTYTVWNDTPLDRHWVRLTDGSPPHTQALWMNTGNYYPSDMGSGYAESELQWCSPNYDFLNAGLTVITYDVDPQLVTGTDTGTTPPTAYFNDSAVLFGSDYRGTYFGYTRALYGDSAGNADGNLLYIDHNGWALYYDSPQPNTYWNNESGSFPTPADTYIHVEIGHDQRRDRDNTQHQAKRYHGAEQLAQSQQVRHGCWLLAQLYHPGMSLRAEHAGQHIL